MSESGHEPAPRPSRARLQDAPRPTARFGSSTRALRLARTSAEQPSRPTGELWPGQAAQDAAREAAQAQGAPPPGGYRPSAYQDQYLAGASLEPFVHPLMRPSDTAAESSAAKPSSDESDFLVDRRVADLGAGAEVMQADGLSAGADATLFARPGHQAVAGSIFAAPEQHAATGSLFARPEPQDAQTILPPAGSRPTPGGYVPIEHADVDHGDGDDGDDEALADGDQPRRRGRTVALVSGLLAIVAAGAGGYAYSALGGGGPQPETALPSSTVAFMKIDLDPSAGQKVDAVRFMQAFPQLRDHVDVKSDLRKAAFTALQGKGELAGVDYDADVAPWLGQRLGVGVVPSATGGGKATVVLALAVTDAAAAREHIPALAAALDGSCEVQEEFAICTQGKDGSALDEVVTATARGSLADAATYRQDLRALGEDGILTGWVDSAKAAELAGALPLHSALLSSPLSAPLVGAVPVSPEGPNVPAAYADAGRTAIALRFDGPHLELAGHTTGAKASFVGTRHVTGMTSLPWDSLAAVSVANGGAQLRAAWPDIEKGLAGALDADPAAAANGAPAAGKAAAAPTKGSQEVLSGGPVAAVEDLLGITVPDDLYAALGSQFTLVFGGIEERNGQPRAALVGNGDQVVLGKLASAGRPLLGDDLTLLPSPGRSVLATSDEYGQEIVKGSGLGDMPSFKDAVKDVDEARVVAYVDIAGLVSQFKDEMDPKDVADLGNLSAMGVTVSGEGHDADFRVRLTTK